MNAKFAVASLCALLGQEMQPNSVTMLAERLKREEKKFDYEGCSVYRRTDENLKVNGQKFRVLVSVYSEKTDSSGKSLGIIGYDGGSRVVVMVDKDGQDTKMDGVPDFVFEPKGLNFEDAVQQFSDFRNDPCKFMKRVEDRGVKPSEKDGKLYIG